MPRDRLSPLDASFLYMDGDVTCNQGAMLHMVDAPLDFDRVLEDMRRKVSSLDRLRQRVVFSPLNLFHPTWEYDPSFDIRNHVRHTTLERPGNFDQLRETVNRCYTTPLDRARSPWAIHVINGLEGNRSCYLVVVHHALTDGIGFARLAQAFYDREPDPLLQDQHRYDPPAVPGPVLRLAYGAVDAVLHAPSTAYNMFHAAATLSRMLTTADGRKGLALLRRFRSAPGLRYPFNAPLCGDTSFALASFSLEDIARVRARHGGTLNDVLLAVVATALDRYARRVGLDTANKQLRVLVPSNIREETTQHKLGNFVSMAPVLAPLGNMSVADRLRAITNYTAEMKRCGLARLLSRGIWLSQTLLTPPGAVVAHRMYASSSAQARANKPGKQPSMNLVVTNLPISAEPLYAGGQPLLSTHVLVPLLPSVGLVCGATSYSGALHVSFTGDTQSVPDIDILPDLLHESYSELLS